MRSSSPVRMGGKEKPFRQKDVYNQMTKRDECVPFKEIAIIYSMATS